MHSKTCSQTLPVCIPKGCENTTNAPLNGMKTQQTLTTQTEFSTYVHKSLKMFLIDDGKVPYRLRGGK